ncbi:mediator of RNA polymerase II transcription subunit 12 [Diutina catenulata]
MSKPRSRNSLLVNHGANGAGSPTPGPTQGDTSHHQSFTMDAPANQEIFPYNDGATQPTYPDFAPWKDAGDDSMNAYLCKGYFEAPIVSNEYCSARNLIQLTLFTSVDNCNQVLNELSSHLANAYRHRNEVINKITRDSNCFSLPPRVTLTASKREAWLRDLANPEVPFSKIGERLPHGIRSKVLIDAICSRQIPMNRALWFTRCVLYGELAERRKKQRADHWLQEWTQQVADYVLKYSWEMSSVTTLEKKTQYMHKYHYMVSYLTQLYVECLVDKTYFLSLVARFVYDGLVDEDAESEYHCGQRLVALELVDVFWNDFIGSDYLLKELCVGLLINHHHLSSAGGWGAPLSAAIADKVTLLFQKNTNLFVMPAVWRMVQPSLVSILTSSPYFTGHEDQLAAQLELVRYRNESLMLAHSASKGQPSATQRALCLLDHGKLAPGVAELLSGSQWRTYLRLVLWWCANCSNSEGVLTVCSWLKQQVVNHQNRLEYEGAIVDGVFDIVTASGVSQNLYVVINELYQLKLMTLAAYLRKLIASGLVYGQAPSAVAAHLNTLHNLPTINNKQCNALLAKMGEPNDNFRAKMEEGKRLLQVEVVDKVLANSFDESFDDLMVRLDDYEVGLRFLLVNWVTNQLKEQLGDSARLIHITPAIMGYLYRFYCKCDNIPVFFKEIVQFALRNEAGVIICYMDTVYLVSRLLMKHMRLVKFVATSSTDPVSVGYRLFDLVVKNYTELSAREFDWFDFGEVWRAVAATLDRVESPAHGSPATHRTEDSPMRFVGDTELTSFAQRVAGVQSLPKLPLEGDELDELVQAVGGESTTQALIERLGKSEPTSEGSNETANIVKLLYARWVSDPVNYDDAIEAVLPSASPRLVVTLLTHGIVQWPQTLEAVTPQVTWTLFTNAPTDHLDCPQSLQWGAVREWFIRSNPDKYTELMVQGLQANPTSPESNRYLKEALGSREPAVVDWVLLLTPTQTLELVNRLEVFPKVRSVQDIVTIAPEVNEINLIFFQFLIRSVVLEESPDLLKLIKDLVVGIRYQFPEISRFFGQIFHMLPWEIKTKVFGHIEDMFVSETKFGDGTVDLELDGVDLLPIFSDTLKEYSAQTGGETTTNNFGEQGPSKDFVNFTQQLIDVANGPNHPDRMKLRHAISVFLRTLIIHRNTIATSLAAHHESTVSFLSMLVAMLQSKFLADDNEKLRIVLQDLLLLIKTQVDDGDDLAALAEPTDNAPFGDIAGPQVDSIVTLDQSELAGGDFNYFNDGHLALVPAERQSDSLVNLLDAGQQKPKTQKFSVSSVEVFEDCSNGLNDGCINLSLFDAYTTRENPP